MRSPPFHGGKRGSNPLQDAILKRIIVYFGVPPIGQSVYIDPLIRKTVSIDKILVVRFNMVYGLITHNHSRES